MTTRKSPKAGGKSKKGELTVHVNVSPGLKKFGDRLRKAAERMKAHAAVIAASPEEAERLLGAHPATGGIVDTPAKLAPDEYGPETVFPLGSNARTVSPPGSAQPKATDTSPLGRPEAGSSEWNPSGWERQFPVVEVMFEQADSIRQGTTQEDLPTDCSRIVAVGYVVREDDKTLVLARSLAESSTAHAYTMLLIPARAIITRRTLAPAENAIARAWTRTKMVGRVGLSYAQTGGKPEVTWEQPVTRWLSQCRGL